MAKPITIPNTFANATTAIPLSQLDNNYSTITASINDANTYSNYAADSGAANAYAITLSGVSTTYTAGLRIQFKAANSNSGASTLNVNSQGAQAIRLTDGSALPANAIVAGAIVDVMYDGTNFQLLSDSNGGQQSFTDVTVTGNLSVTGTSGFTGNVTIRGGTANNVVASNINVTSVQATFPNSYLSNSSATLGNATVTLGGTTSTVGNLTLQNANITSVAATFPNSYLTNNSVTVGNTSIALGSTAASIGNLTVTNVTISSVSTAITAAQGGTGQTSLTANNVVLGNGANAVQFVAPGTNGNVLTSNGTTWLSQAPAAGGTVTNVSVASANGFAGTVATSNTTPNITISTTITGILNGNGTAISAASAGTDYVRPNTASTFTATQTFNGSSSTLGMVIADAAETTTVSATAATGTINYDVTTQSVLFYTTNASANWTVNLRASSGTSMNTLLATGQSITVAFLVTQGATAYYNTTVQVDGTTSGVTTRWQGGTAPTAGNASGVDVYTYTVVKTGSATFSVFASQTRFA